MSDEYHGIVLNISQKDKSIFKWLQVIGCRKALLGLITQYKIRIDLDQIEGLITDIQSNMANNIGPFKQEYYAHFYKDTELIIVYRDKSFKVTTDRSTWAEAVSYGRSLNILEKQLDFTPCKFAEETF
jgi:hypothetical protein